MSAVFRLNWVQESPAGLAKCPAPSAVTGIRPRRAHTKSRKGCSACKKRKKKCDEHFPVCGQCQHLKTRCDYITSRVASDDASRLTRSRPQYAMSRQYARNQVLRVIDFTNTHDQLGRKPVHVDALRLLDHFLNDESSWIGAPECQKALQKHGVQMGLESPHLLHAILAFAAGHIDNLQSNRKYRLTAVHHFDRLIALYAAQIPWLDTENVVPLYGSCTLLTMLSYLVVGFDNNGALEDHRCDWSAFRALQGGRLLQEMPALRRHLSQSVWLPALQESGPWEEKHINDCGQRKWASETMEELAALCGILPDSKDENNVYLAPLERLNLALDGTVDESKIGQLMLFASKLSPAFMRVLEALDPRAMLILAYWHAFLLQTGQWWITWTGLGACRRMCDYLWSIGDDKLRRLVRFPAAQCGFDLDSLEEAVTSFYIDLDGKVTRLSSLTETSSESSSEVHELQDSPST